MIGAELRRAFRLLGLGLYLLLGLLVVSPMAAASRRPEVHSRRWFRGLLRVLHVQLEIDGEPAPGPVMLAGNHISWLDIAVIVAARPVLFVSKAEVGRWPLIGWMARAGGTLFIERGAHATTALYQAISERLREGRAVVIFPEGTTTDGRGVKRFQARLFAAAILADTPVQPFALRYGQDCVPYVGDDVMFWHLLRLLREPRLDVRLSFGTPLAPGEQRKALAARTQAWVESRLPECAPAAYPKEDQPAPGHCADQKV